eukprot:6201168-Pleurochrysis_carterae.AAC.1
MSTPRLPRLAQVNLKAHYKYHSVEVAEDVRTSALKMGLKVSGAIPLPTTIEKWSFLKSPSLKRNATFPAYILFDGRAVVIAVGTTNLQSDHRDLWRRDTKPRCNKDGKLQAMSSTARVGYVHPA